MDNLPPVPCDVRLAMDRYAVARVPRLLTCERDARFQWMLKQRIALSIEAENERRDALGLRRTDYDLINRDLLPGQLPLTPHSR